MAASPIHKEGLIKINYRSKSMVVTYLEKFLKQSSSIEDIEARHDLKQQLVSLIEVNNREMSTMEQQSAEPMRLSLDQYDNYAEEQSMIEQFTRQMEEQGRIIHVTPTFRKPTMELVQQISLSPYLEEVEVAD